MPAFNVSRSILIHSDPKTVFDTFSDFRSWQTWSPWMLADKDVKLTLQGDPQAVGGGFSWDGPVVGAGQMQHVKMQPPASGRAGSLHMQLRFTRPWKSESKVDFEFKPGRDRSEGETTLVRWDMAGALPFFLFWMKPMMVSLISMDYDRGLRMVKELIETGRVDSKTVVNGITNTPARSLVGLPGKTSLVEIEPAMEHTLSDVKKRLLSAGIATDAQWLSVYDKMCMKTQTVEYTTGMLVADLSRTPDGLIAKSIAGTQAMKITHTGRYHHLGNAWFTAYQNVQAGKHKPAKNIPSFEVYVSDPDKTAEADLVTEVFVPIR